MKFSNITNTILKDREDYIRFYLTFDSDQERFVPISLPMAFNSFRKPRAFIGKYTEKNNFVIKMFVNYVNENLNKHFTTTQLDENPSFKFKGHKELSKAIKDGTVKLLTSKGSSGVFLMNFGSDFYYSFIKRANIVFDGDDAVLKILNNMLIKDIKYYKDREDLVETICAHYNKQPTDTLPGVLKKSFNFEQINLFNFFNKEFKGVVLDTDVSDEIKEYLITMFYNIVLLDRYFTKLGRFWNPSIDVDWEEIKKDSTYMFKNSCKKFVNPVYIDKDIKKEWLKNLSKPDKNFVRYSEEELKNLFNIK